MSDTPTPRALRDSANRPWEDSPFGRDPRDPEWQAREAARIFLRAFTAETSTAEASEASHKSPGTPPKP